MSLTLIYWSAFLAYSGLVVGIGVVVWRRQHRRAEPDTTHAFWTADQKLNGWSTGFSISASMLSISWSCVYGVQLFYWYGIGAAWLLVIPWLLTMAGFFVLAPLFRRLKAFSQPELLERRFGTRSRQVLAPAIAFVFVVWAGAEIYAAGITIAPFLDLSVPATLALIAVVVAAYSYTGGFAAVVSTDKIQFALVAGFIAVMAWVGLTAIESDLWLAKLADASRTAPKRVAGTPWWLTPGAALVAMTFFAYLPGWLVETDVWIRLQAAATTGEARRGLVLAGLNAFVFVGVLPLCIGLTALVLYPPDGSAIPEHLQDGALIFSQLMNDFTPVWLNALLGIGLVAAAMSTVDTCGNVVALSLSYDLLEPWLRKRGWTTQRLDRLARSISVVAIGLAFFYALFTESLWDIFYLSSGILTTTVFLPVVSAFHPKTMARQVLFAASFGFTGTLAFYFLETRGHLTALEPEWLAATEVGYILLGFACALLGFIAGRLIQRPQPALSGEHQIVGE